MTVPSVRSTGSVVGAPGGANINAIFTAPATIAVDDILVLICLTNSTKTLTGLPSGWAHVLNSPQISSGGGGNESINVCWKRAVSGDVGASSYTFNLNASDYFEGAISSVKDCITTGSPWDTGAGAPVAAGGGGTGTTTAPALSLTTQGPDRLLINGAVNQTGGTPWTPPTGFTTDFDHTGGGSFSVCVGFHKAQAVAGATGTVQATCPGSGQTAAWLGALLPVSGGAPANNGAGFMALFA